MLSTNVSEDEVATLVDSVILEKAAE